MLREFILEKFQGPLDLLIGLIDEAKLSITEISLGKVTEQFFGHLGKIGESQSDELADFLVVGTKLVYLKSKELLPYLQPEEADGPSLADQLKLYKRYADASKIVAKLWEQNWIGYGRVEPVARVAGFFPPVNVNAHKLQASFELLLKRLKPVDVLPQVKLDRSVSVKQKIQDLYTAIKKFHRLTFSETLGRNPNRSDVIVSFLALLELIKQARVGFKQGTAFSELEINNAV